LANSGCGFGKVNVRSGNGRAGGIEHATAQAGGDLSDGGRAEDGGKKQDGKSSKSFHAKFSSRRSASCILVCLALNSRLDWPESKAQSDKLREVFFTNLDDCNRIVKRFYFFAGGEQPGSQR
jgi:hypothetical protein